MVSKSLQIITFTFYDFWKSKNVPFPVLCFVANIGRYCHESPQPARTTRGWLVSHFMSGFHASWARSERIKGASTPAQHSTRYWHIDLTRVTALYDPYIHWVYICIKCKHVDVYVDVWLVRIRRNKHSNKREVGRRTWVLVGRAATLWDVDCRRVRSN